MTKTVSTRLDEDEVDELERIAEEEHLDRSALIRKFLVEDIREYRLREAAEAVRTGRKSMAEAARHAGVSGWTLAEHLRRENIQPPPQSAREIEEELSDALEG